MWSPSPPPPVLYLPPPPRSSHQWGSGMGCGARARHNPRWERGCPCGGVGPGGPHGGGKGGRSSRRESDMISCPCITGRHGALDPHHLAFSAAFFADPTWVQLPLPFVRQLPTSSLFPTPQSTRFSYDAIGDHGPQQQSALFSSLRLPATMPC